MDTNLNALKAKVSNAMTKLPDTMKQAVIATSLAMMSAAPAYAAIPTGNTNLKDSIEKALTLIFGFVAVGGLINIVLGIRNLAAGVSDEGGGQDQQKISKGRGQLFSGLIMAGGVAALTLLGLDPNTIVSTYFK